MAGGYGGGWVKYGPRKTMRQNDNPDGPCIPKEARAWHTPHSAPMFCAVGRLFPRYLSGQSIRPKMQLGSVRRRGSGKARGMEDAGFEAHQALPPPGTPRFLLHFLWICLRCTRDCMCCSCLFENEFLQENLIQTFFQIDKFPSYSRLVCVTHASYSCTCFRARARMHGMPLCPVCMQARRLPTSDICGINPLRVGKDLRPGFRALRACHRL